MTTATILLVGYPVALALLVLLDKATGWVIADAFGKEPPTPVAAKWEFDTELADLDAPRGGSRADSPLLGFRR
jgi:hypothetical protein